MTFTETFDINVNNIMAGIDQKVKDCITDSIHDEIWQYYGERVEVYFDEHEDEWNVLLQAVVDRLAESFRKYGVETW